jgi:hypothetical protein
MSDAAERLYGLLPAVYRTRDAESGWPLRALIAVIAEQVAVLEDDLAQSYDDQFIETCAEWVVPYIGDLVATTPLFDSIRLGAGDDVPTVFADLNGPRFVMAASLRSRADVAKTLRYRRRKATRPMLEELARDVTGWAAHAVEFFSVLRWTQYVRDHLRLDSHGAPDLRNPEQLDRIGGPFDLTTRAIDVRPIADSGGRGGPRDGRYRIPTIGFFLWRLKSFPARDVAARPVAGPGDWRYHVSPLGSPAPLFARWDSGRKGDLALEESRLPAPIRRTALDRDLRAYATSPAPRAGASAYYGRIPGAPSTTLPDAPLVAFTIVRDGETVPPEKIRFIRLKAWCQPKGEIVGVDPELGRISFGTAFVPARGVDVYYHHAFSGALGGGSYDRQAFLARRSPDLQRFVVDQRGLAAGSHPTIGGALGAWAAAGKPHAIVTIADSRSYEEAIAIALPPAGTLVLEAADGERPHLRLTGALTVSGDFDGSVTLSGLLVEGSVRVRGDLGRLRILHTTLVPGQRLSDTGAPATTDPSLLVDGSGATGAVTHTRLQTEVAYSILGPLRIPAHAKDLWITDSIIDGVGTHAIAGLDATHPFGPPTSLARTTVFGAVDVRQLTSATEVIFGGPVAAERRQLGCVRFSFVAPASTTPRRFRCQPDLAIAGAIEAEEKKLHRALTAAERQKLRDEITGWLRPAFTSERYGDPGYAQLLAGRLPQITAGAEDGSEMGAFCQLKQAQRESNLRVRLREYLPLGLEPAITYVT